MTDAGPSSQSLQPITRAVVTGASGFIGRALVAHLKTCTVDVITVSRRPAAGSEYRDLKVPGALDSLLDESTVIFHMAAEADVSKSVHDPRSNFEGNVLGTFEVLESVRRTGCRLIFPSTASVYDSQNALPLQERSHIKPTSPYGASKVTGEAYCEAYHRSYQSDVRIARLFSVYGPGMDRFVIYDLVRKIRNNSKRIEIRGDGNQIRDYLYIDDVVRGLIQIAEKGMAGEEYNLAAGVPVRILDLAREVATLMGCPEIEIVPTGEPSSGDIPKWYADIRKIEEIGFTPQISLQQGLLRTISYLLEAKPGVAGLA